MTEVVGLVHLQEVKTYQVQLCMLVLTSSCNGFESPVDTDENAATSSGSSTETASTSQPGGTLSRSDSYTSASSSAPSEPSSDNTQASAQPSASTNADSSSANASTNLSETASTAGPTSVEGSSTSIPSGADSTVSTFSSDSDASTNMGSTSTVDTSGPSLEPLDDYSQAGPFTPTMDRGVGPDGAYTVYRPETLGEDGFLHAPIIFGPGISQQVTVHSEMLTNFASHGFVVVGTPVLEGRPGDAGNLEKMQRGLDWILEQNTLPGMYEGKLWTDHAVSMGFSVGGTAAVQLGGDPSVATVVSIHGHTATAALHGTMLQTTGTQDTVGMPLQQNTFDTSTVPTFLATLTGASHPYIEADGGGEERPVILAWMRYWIYADAGGESFFFGDDCTACRDPWENPQRKNWDAVSGQQ